MNAVNGKYPIIILSAALLLGCHSADQNREALAPVRIEENRLVLPENSSQLAAISIEPVQKQEKATLHLNGRLVWDDNVTVRIFTPFAGRVTRLLVEPGRAVKQGDPLALIASPDYGQAQADARKAATDFVLAERNLSRVRELFEHGAAPQKELQSAEADHA